MRGHRVSWLAGTTIGVIACAAHGGIKYKLSGDTTVYDASGGTVNVGTVNGIKTVTIYDDDGTGLDTDIPALTIRQVARTRAPDLGFARSGFRAGDSAIQNAIWL